MGERECRLVFLFEHGEGPLKIQDTNNAGVGGAVVALLPSGSGVVGCAGRSECGAVLLPLLDADDG
jgi:hypothetical protein